MVGSESRSEGLTAWFRFKTDSLAIGFAGRHLGFGRLPISFCPGTSLVCLVVVTVEFSSLCFFTELCVPKAEIHAGFPITMQN